MSGLTPLWSHRICFSSTAQGWRGTLPSFPRHLPLSFFLSCVFPAVCTVANTSLTHAFGLNHANINNSSLKPNLAQKPGLLFVVEMKPKLPSNPNWLQKLQGEVLPLLAFSLYSSFFSSLSNRTGELTWPAHIWQPSLETLFIWEQYSPWERKSSPLDKTLSVCVCVRAHVMSVIAALMTSATATLRGWEPLKGFTGVWRCNWQHNRILRLLLQGWARAWKIVQHVHRC